MKQYKVILESNQEFRIEAHRLSVDDNKSIRLYIDSDDSPSCVIAVIPETALIFELKKDESQTKSRFQQKLEEKLEERKNQTK